MESEKKTFNYLVNSTMSIDYAGLFIGGFSMCFWVHRFDNTKTARNFF